jgi:hypothetical protein
MHDGVTRLLQLLCDIACIEQLASWKSAISSPIVAFGMKNSSFSVSEPAYQKMYMELDIMYEHIWSKVRILQYTYFACMHVYTYIHVLYVYVCTCMKISIQFQKY